MLNDNNSLVTCVLRVAQEVKKLEGEAKEIKDKAKKKTPVKRINVNSALVSYAFRMATNQVRTKRASGFQHLSTYCLSRIGLMNCACSRKASQERILIRN